MKRRKTKKIKVGNLYIGGNMPISVQSMCNTPTRNVSATVKQIKELERAGCQIIRVAVPDMVSAKSLRQIKRQINIPLVADIHFDYHLALEAIEQGVDKLRINPGNIGKIDKIRQVIIMAKKKRIPIRIGVNAGSLEKDLLDKFASNATPQAMVLSALRHIKILEQNKFYNILVSLKANDISRTVQAYRLLAKKVPYPFHLGITEAGTEFAGGVRSAIGIGIMLAEGIGDTIRVSLTADPVKEIKVGKEILRSLDLLKEGCRIISCPTCARSEIDVQRIAEKVEKMTRNVKKPLRIAVMGCVVNGPGEAREADVGLAAGRAGGVIFTKGKIVGTFPKRKLFNKLITEINKLK